MCIYIFYNEEKLFRKINQRRKAKQRKVFAPRVPPTTQAPQHQFLLSWPGIMGLVPLGT